MYKPYVVSADVYLLMKNWATQRGFVLPPEEFFRRLREDFLARMQRMFPDLELVPEEEIVRGLAKLVARGSLPVVSLDRIYFEGELNLEIARLVDETGEDRGLGRRAGTPPLLKQVRKLRVSGVREVAILDDVIFTGSLLERTISLLSRLNVRVPLVYAGIGIAEGVKRINGTRREVRCVRAYEEVIDEVCERDFYPGVPLSGRLLAGGDNIGVPYLSPFGNPERWASIPSGYAADFSKFCLHQTISLFDEIEQRSGRTVRCQDLERKVAGLPTDGTRYTDALHKVL